MDNNTPVSVNGNLISYGELKQQIDLRHLYTFSRDFLVRSEFPLTQVSHKDEMMRQFKKMFQQEPERDRHVSPKGNTIRNQGRAKSRNSLCSCGSGRKTKRCCRWDLI